ncbi:uncharacterized protein TRIADDRAFT_29866 [Trichoplax adhaerens]|uniref:Nondiscriminating glutamyl-tRNA synthetase EARS2, mitochondrial n=1 Tax=Trichoplax adhaerens TaxID=10228 RepID=B3S612_TRIAD|nr:hypothetical protein TRIADDRAFT_29866 [Trichoplax adhaerens]EDV21900.1 hypothetical protein TRIADDRAFT_29866 [Trichoplax adhaerens]|eukprot:XP_002115537.1 hypothetical protein TRIADDRAFT_29866 [Trichoplax adhaerens]
MIYVANVSRIAWRIVLLDQRFSSNCASNKSNVRVRFAPSPTGMLHLGGLRTMLYNYLFARQQRGQVILRIEDTDQTRLVPGADKKLEEIIWWSGLHYDEGPSVAGEYGPYYQSQRIPLYQKYANRLIENDYAYPCFCTQRELDLVKMQNIKSGLNPRYNGKCRSISREIASARIQNGESHVIRLKVPDGQTNFYDQVYGEMSIDNKSIEDQVLIKSDGFPTYHMANVVDDHLMDITHVLRGEEWLSSTAKHALIYKGLTWICPQFVHLPLLHNITGGKLSKRHGDVFVESFKTAGYMPEAVVNFVAFLGWSPDPTGRRQLFTIDEMINEFSLENLRRTAAKVDYQKLSWFQRQYHTTRCKNESKLEALVSELKELVIKTTCNG